MKSGALVWAVVAAGFLAGGVGCQQASSQHAAGSGGDSIVTAGVQSGAAADANAGKTVSVFYTHDGAELLYRQAKYADAQAMCNQAIDAITRAKGDKSPELAPPLIDLATVDMRLAKFEDARKALDRAEGLLDKSKPEQALILGRLGINKGWRLYTLGQTDAATKTFEDSEELVKKNSKGDSRDLAELINNVGLMYEETAEKEEDDALLNKARTCLLQGWEMRKRVTGDESYETAESLNNLGMHLLFNGKSPEEADLGMNTLRKSLEVAKKVYGENHPETAMSHAVMALALLMHDDVDEAEREIKIAMPMTERYFGEMHPDRSFELMTLGRVYVEQNHFDQAEKAFAEALDIDQHVYGKTHSNVVPALEALQGLYEKEGNSEKSLDMKRQIEELSGKAL